MIIRKMKKDEYKQVKMISSVAFEFPIDYEELMKEEQNPNKPVVVNGIEEEVICAFSDDEKTMYSSVGVRPFEVNFDGHNVMLGGIGGVATLPPYRRLGAVRESFSCMLNSLKEKDIPLSYLYPFSCSYYRKFGYEVVNTGVTWTIYFKGLKKFGVGGSTEFLMPNATHERIDAIYKKMYEGYNLAVNRTEDCYKYFKERNTFNDKRYAYIWKNDMGEDKGYIMMNKIQEEDYSIMDCTHHFRGKNDFFFADKEGLKGLLDFALTFSSDYDGIRFTLPKDMDITGLINEQNSSSTESKAQAMVRVVDVKKILELAKYKDSGKLSIKIHDKHCEWNDKVFIVKWSENRAVSVTEGGTDFDIELDISTFSALITGCYADVESCYKEDIHIINKEADFDKVFYFKKNRLLDLF